MASNSLTLDGPRIGYARLLVANNVPYYSTILDSKSVITLGHSARVPLIGPRSELGYRFEPTTIFVLLYTEYATVAADAAGRGVPGVGAAGGYREGAIPVPDPGSISQN